jgi:hypothetical protein
VSFQFLRHGCANDCAANLRGRAYLISLSCVIGQTSVLAGSVKQGNDRRPSSMFLFICFISCTNVYTIQLVGTLVAFTASAITFRTGWAATVAAMPPAAPPPVTRATEEEEKDKEADNAAEGFSE